MKAAQPAADFVTINVDLVAVERFTITVRDLATGELHVLSYDGIAIGANEAGAGYTLILPLVIAQIQGLADVA